MQIPQWLTSLQRQIEVRLQQQQRGRQDGGVAAAVAGLQWPEWHWNWRWPWHQGRHHAKKPSSSSQQREGEEYKRKLAALCSAVKAEDVSDLEDVLGAMVLSECVYKRPDSEVLRAVNKFKADFGGHLVSVNLVQASLDHVPHRYLLAEAGNTLFVSFIGTKQLQDVVADANFLQKSMFGGDVSEGEDSEGEEQVKEVAIPHHPPSSSSSGSNAAPRKAVVGLNNGDLPARPVKLTKGKPAAHRGFLARANGVPATELYRLAQRKDRRLVLCGHSLGGAVAVLATLAILRAFASTTSISRAANKVQVKCITFSQPPVGNAALRDYVHKKGWQHHFRTYCIPEDVIPRILSPAYFEHYRSQTTTTAPPAAAVAAVLPEQTPREEVRNGDKTEGSQIVLATPNPFWRLPKLVPLAAVPMTSLQWLKGKRKEDDNGELANSNEGEVGATAAAAAAPASSQLLEIREDSEGVELESKPPSGSDGKLPGGVAAEWLDRVPSLPSLPSYVPFGQLYLLDKLSVQPLSTSEYTQLSSVQSVLLEMRERFHSHSMRSYRGRFQQIYNLCMSKDVPVSNKENFPLLPHLQQWLSTLGGQLAEVGRILDPITIKLATAMVPLGWTGLVGEKKGCKPLKVDILGHGLHLCTLVRARVNGRWCATSIEVSPPTPFLDIGRASKLQRMRIRIGDPLQQSSMSEQERSALSTSEATMNELQQHDAPHSSDLCDMGDVGRGSSSSIEVEGLGEVTIFCSTDFMTASREVAMRLRRVRLLGFEGAGKTSLYFALLGGEGMMLGHNFGGMLPDMDWREGVVGGVSYVDAPGVNLQDLPGDAERLQKELSVKVGPNSKKLDLVILVHNLAHKIPQMRASSRPALALLTDEVAAAGVPFILAITNKFAVSADRRHLATVGVMETYQVPPNLTVVINSCPHVVHGVVQDEVQEEKEGAGWQPQRLISGSMNLVQRPFRRREVVQSPQGVENLQTLVHNVLIEQEEAAMKEFSRQALAYETAKEMASLEANKHDYNRLAGATTAAGIGAGFGLVVAVLVGAANSLRKP
jgi:pimeloyl-ACP methyl ester carboxylesterase